MTVPGLKVIMSCFSCIHSAVREVTLIDCYQNYYPRLRTNTGVCVLTDQILTTHMHVSQWEPTYASGKEAHVLIYYIKTRLL
jgi:hypothetical protein